MSNLPFGRTFRPFGRERGEVLDFFGYLFSCYHFDKEQETYPIEVDCANCANLMEDAAKKTEGVADAVVNFMTQKMTVEFADGQDPKTVMKAVLKNCKKVEDDCEIYL